MIKNTIWSIFLTKALRVGNFVRLALFAFLPTREVLLPAPGLPCEPFVRFEGSRLLRAVLRLIGVLGLLALRIARSRALSVIGSMV